MRFSAHGHTQPLTGQRKRFYKEQNPQESFCAKYQSTKQYKQKDKKQTGRNKQRSVSMESFDRSFSLLDRPSG